MGLFDSLFGKGSRDDRFVNKHVKRLLSKYSQKEIREESMHALAQRGTPEAILGLLQRFTYNHPETIVDENEKRRVIALLEQLGAERAVQPLHEYLNDPRQTEVSMVLIALESLTGAEETCKTIVELLDASDPDDVWSRDRKLQLVNHLAEYEHEDSIEALVRFLQDINDDVVFRCLDVLDKIGEDDQIREGIIELAIREDTSARILARILDLVRERKWFIGNYRKELEPNLPEGYYFDKRDNIKKSN